MPCSKTGVHSSPSLHGSFPPDTEQYGVHNLVFAEFHDTMEQAIVREKRVKKWRRAWKIRLIEEANPEWRDLYDQIGV